MTDRIDKRHNMLKAMIGSSWGLQTAQHTSGGAVTANSSCCANCVEPPRPQQWGPDLPFFWASRPCGPAGWLAQLLTKAGDVETNPGPTTLNKKVWICDICHFFWVDNNTMVYVDLQYDEISLTFTAGPVCLCGVSSPVVVLGLFVRLS